MGLFYNGNCEESQNKTKQKQNRKPEWKQKQWKWSWTEAWVKIERMIIIAAPPKKDCFLDCDNAITNSVMISYSWQENEKFAREMLHLFTCTAKNKIHFVADFITELYQVRRLVNIPLTFTEFYIVFTALTNVPFGIWKRTTFYCPDQDIFLRTTICKFPLQCFWSTAKFTSGHPFPHQKKPTTTNK